MAVLKMNFLSQALGMQTNVTICLPSYSFADRVSGREEVYVPGMKYQVLWLLHGGSGDDSDYVNFSNIVRYADNHKVAVVMPADFNAMYMDDPDGAKYFTYVIEELPTMCAAIFPFSTKREDNFVAGLSMGGAGTFRCAMLHPEKYSVALCMSGAGSDPSIIREGGAANIRRRRIEPGSADDAWAAAKRNVDEGKEIPKLYFAVGDKDFVLDGVRKCRDYVSGLGYDITYEEIPGYGHEWDFWDLILRRAFNEGWFPIKNSAIYPED